MDGAGGEAAENSKPVRAFLKNRSIESGAIIKKS